MRYSTLLATTLALLFPTALAANQKSSRNCNVISDGAKRCAHYMGYIEICEGGNWRFYEDCVGGDYCGDLHGLGNDVRCISNEAELGPSDGPEPYQ